jgi:accessory colonization factor AcfC
MRTHALASARRAIVLAGALLFGAAVQADEIRVMSSGGFAASHLDLVSPFERSTKHKVITYYVSPEAAAAIRKYGMEPISR